MFAVSATEHTRFSFAIPTSRAIMSRSQTNEQARRFRRQDAAGGGGEDGARAEGNQATTEKTMRDRIASLRAQRQALLSDVYEIDAELKTLGTGRRPCQCWNDE